MSYFHNLRGYLDLTATACKCRLFFILQKLFGHNTNPLANVVFSSFYRSCLDITPTRWKMSSFLHFTEAIWTKAPACKCRLFYILPKLFGHRSNPLAIIVFSTFYNSCRIHPLANIVFSTFYRSCLDRASTRLQMLSSLHFTEAVWT